MSEDYRVSLDHFAGPLDLLLHLIRKEEVDIHDIPIARIIDQYNRHVALLADLDLEDAGDFLVMAATLMVIKSRMLLPAEDVDLEEEIDPRYELVQQLLEYKRVKDSTRGLLDRAETFAQMVGRPDSARPDPIKGEDRSLADVGLFDILEAFGKILESIGTDSNRKERHIRVTDRPVRVYVQELTSRLQSSRSLLFSEICRKDLGRPDLIGWFLALLLLLKQEMVSCAQDGPFGDIRISYKGTSDEAELSLDLEDDFR